MFPGLKKAHVAKLNLFVSHHGCAFVGIMVYELLLEAHSSKMCDE